MPTPEQIEQEVQQMVADGILAYDPEKDTYSLTELGKRAIDATYHA